VRLETEPGKYQQLWKPPAAAGWQHDLCAAKKPIFTTITNIINQAMVCSDRKLLLTTLILLNK